MKKILFILALLVSLTTFGQHARGTRYYDCNAKPITLVGSMNLGVSDHGDILMGVKIGGWQNNKDNGFTLFTGYSQVTHRMDGVKQKDSSVVDFSYLFELGWKMRITPDVVVHGYTGIDRYHQFGNPYVGGSLLFNMNKDLLAGLNYKTALKEAGTSYGVILYFAF